MSRRDLFATSGRLGIGLAAAASLGGVLASPAAAESGARGRTKINGVELPAYPLFPNLARTMTPAQDLLDELACEYGRSTRTPTMDDFLLGWAPSRLFERVMHGSHYLDLSEAIWLLHLTGYFGGIWLRLEFAEFGNGRAGSPPTEARFNTLATRLDGIVAAANGSDAEVLAFAEASLRGASLVGLADFYGYNAGYLDQILGGSAPSGVVAPTDYFAFTEDGVFDATYSGSELRGMRTWRRLATPRGPSRQRIEEIIAGSGGADDLRAITAAGVGRGRFTWTLPFLSIEGWDQRSYNSLLSTSASFLQAIQITGLGAIAAAARGNHDWARRVASANALLAPFGGSYSVGLFDNTYDGLTSEEALPKFVT